MSVRYLSYAHSVIYAALLYVAFVDRDDDLVTVFGWAHGILWILLSVICLELVRRRTLPIWLAVLVAVVGGVGPFAGSLGFLVHQRRSR